MISTGSRDEAGASSIEYGLIVFAIAAVIVAILFLLGGVVRETYDDSCDHMATTAASASVISMASCDS
jgi:pilus assembly protein Flp/PilA